MIETQPTYGPFIEEMAPSIEPSPLAIAITQRREKLEQFGKSVVARFVAEEPKTVEPSLRKVLSKSSIALTQLSLNFPQSTLSPERVINTIIDALPNDEAVSLLPTDEETNELFDGETTRKLIKTSISSAGKAFNVRELTSSAMPNPADFLDGAKKMADEKNIPIESVFADDELYSELCRRTYTPISFATKLFDVQNIIVDKDFAPRMLDFLLEVTMAAVKASGEEEEDENTLTAEEIEEFKEAPEISEAIEAMKTSISAAMILTTREYILIIWGEDGINKLPEYMREKFTKAEEILRQVREASSNSHK